MAAPHVQSIEVRRARLAGQTATTVAAAMIVRNEHAFLPACLASLAGQVDQVVIVDTGSTDHTVEIAVAAGAVVCSHPWNDDFAAARNVALEAATSDWILYIDADERLTLPTGAHLADFLTDNAIAAFVRFRPKTGYTRYRELRLFRRDPRIRFVGKIHESPNAAIYRIAALEGRAILRSAIEIDHYGYDGDQSHKHPRNLPLLLRCVEDWPDRVYYWHHLAETLLAMGDEPGAEQAGQQGLAAAQRDPSQKQFADASLIYQLLARQRLTRGEEALALIDDGLARVPDDYALLFLRGQAVLASHPQTALDIALRLRALAPDDLCDGLLAFQRGIFEEKACELAALAYLRLDRRGEAADFFTQAAALAPDPWPFRVKAAALAGRRVA